MIGGSRQSNGGWLADAAMKEDYLQKKKKQDSMILTLENPEFLSLSSPV